MREYTQPAKLHAPPMSKGGSDTHPDWYYNIKARRLRNLCLFLDRAGGLEAFAALARTLHQERAAAG